MIDRDFYKVRELQSMWEGRNPDHFMRLAGAGILRLSVAFAVPSGVHNLHVTIADLSGRHGVERIPFDAMPSAHDDIFWLCSNDVWTLVEGGEVDLQRAYTLDGDLVVFEWPPGTGFKVTRENVVVRYADLEEGLKKYKALTAAISA